jgi:hypothetical protein
LPEACGRLILNVPSRLKAADVEISRNDIQIAAASLRKSSESDLPPARPLQSIIVKPFGVDAVQTAVARQPDMTLVIFGNRRNDVRWLSPALSYTVEIFSRRKRPSRDCWYPNFAVAPADDFVKTGRESIRSGGFLL